MINQEFKESSNKEGPRASTMPTLRGLPPMSVEQSSHASSTKAMAGFLSPQDFDVAHPDFFLGPQKTRSSTKAIANENLFSERCPPLILPFILPLILPLILWSGGLSIPTGFRRRTPRNFFGTIKTRSSPKTLANENLFHAPQLVKKNQFPFL